MTKPIKILSFIFLLSFFCAHGMEDKTCLDSSEAKTLDTQKDPLLLVMFSDEILRNILHNTSSDNIYNAITLLMRLSCVCKKLEQLSMPKKIKSILGLDQRMLDDNLYTYAFLESNHNFTPLFKLLITMGADINRYCKDLISCVKFTTNVYLVNHFIACGANIDQQDKNGNTALRYAVDLNQPNVIKLLLKHNADMYLANKNRETPTDMALLYGRVKCLKLFIDHGVDTTIEYNRGSCSKETIASWAQMARNQEIYSRVTKEKMPMHWYEKSGDELLDDTCSIS